MCWRGGLHVLAAAVVLAVAAPSWATPPITEPYRHTLFPAQGDSGQVAREATRTALSATTTGVVAGLAMFVIGFAGQSGGVVLVGYGSWAVGVTAGPTLGWDRAGYPGRGTLGALLRAATIAGAIAIPVFDPKTRASEFGGLVVATAALTGLVVATFEAYYDCDAIQPYVREHGLGRRAMSLAPVTTPSGAPGLAWVVHFD